jgi:hypothetical protein
MMAKITVAGQIEEQIRALQKSLAGGPALKPLDKYGFSHLFTGSTIAMAFPAIERD